jgi:hypothetical protein
MCEELGICSAKRTLARLRNTTSGRNHVWPGFFGNVAISLTKSRQRSRAHACRNSTKHNQVGDASHRVGAPTETEQENAVAGLIVTDDKFVTVGDVRRDSPSRPESADVRFGSVADTSSADVNVRFVAKAEVKTTWSAKCHEPTARVQDSIKSLMLGVIDRRLSQAVADEVKVTADYPA